MIPRIVLSLVVLATAATVGASGQGLEGSFRVGPRVGYDTYRDRTSIDPGALLGVEAAYFFTDHFAFGAYIDFSRTSTDGEFFPAELTFGAEDSTLIFAVTQPLTIIKYGGHFTGTVTLGERFSPFVLVGAGVYQIELDPQVNRANNTLNEFQLTFGGGVDINLSASSGIRLDVRDYVLTSFDRDRLNPVDPRFRPVRFPDVLPAPAPLCSSNSCTEHNLVFAASFQFTPGGAR